MKLFQKIFIFPEFKMVLLHEKIMVILMKWRYWNCFFTIFAKWSIFCNWQAVDFSISNCNDPICFQVGPNILPANGAPNLGFSFRTSSLFVYSHHDLDFFTWLKWFFSNLRDYCWFFDDFHQVTTLGVE